MPVRPVVLALLTAALVGAACAGSSGSPDDVGPPVTPWCADGDVDTDQLPEAVEAAWADGDHTAVLVAAEAAWAEAIATAPGLFHPTEARADVDVAEAEGADTSTNDGEAAGADADDGAAASDLDETENTDARAERARALRAWTRTWRDAPRPVVDVGLDRFVPARPMTEAAVEAALHSGDATALATWLDRAGATTGDWPELGDCAAMAAAVGRVP